MKMTLREIDAAILKHVFSVNLDMRSDCPYYSQSIADAWQVVEKIDLLNGRTLEKIDGEYWIDDEPSHCIQSHAKTAPLCIAIAALKSVGVDVEASE